MIPYSTYLAARRAARRAQKLDRTQNRWEATDYLGQSRIMENLRDWAIKEGNAPIEIPVPAPGTIMANWGSW